jgi:hypothetical protein
MRCFMNPLVDSAVHAAHTNRERVLCAMRDDAPLTIRRPARDTVGEMPLALEHSIFFNVHPTHPYSFTGRAMR